MPQIDFTEGAPDWDPPDQDFAEREGDMTDVRGALVEEAAIEKGPMMVISDVSTRTSGIDVLSDEDFVLMMESNVNVSNKFTTAAMTNMEMHKIMSVRNSSSRRSLTINHYMLQSIWRIHPALTNNMFECTTQRGVRISCPRPLLTNQIQTNNNMPLYN